MAKPFSNVVFLSLKYSTEAKGMHLLCRLHVHETQFHNQTVLKPKDHFLITLIH